MTTQLTWTDHARHVMAYASGDMSISEELVYNTRHLPVTIWPLRDWKYTYRLAPQLASARPLNSFLPTLVMCKDGRAVEGCSLILPGPWRVWDTAEASFAYSVIFHIDNFMQETSVSMLDLLLALPKLLEVHLPEIEKAFGQEVADAAR